MEGREEYISELLLTLNDGQKSVFEECINGRRSIFCTGQGGTGKSWLLECVVKYFKQYPLPDSKLLAVTASTGIASFLIRGITLHRFAGVGIEETDVDAMIQRASRGQSKMYWETTDTLIIDEVSMISATFFENLSLVAKFMRSSTEPFGGMRLIMFGDFLQLPPVSKIDHPSARVFHSDAWRELDIKVMQLTEMVRQSDPQFIKVLSEIRYGVCSPESERYILALDRETELAPGLEPVRLYARKNLTEAYNMSRLNEIHTSSRVYNSVDSGDRNSLKQCPALQRLELKTGCQVMVIRNVSPEIVNGSVGTVVGFSSGKPSVNLRMPDGSSKVTTIARTTWETVAPNGNIVASRSQVPLILAWAMTIHRSQGQTLSNVCVDMSGIFEVGQAYVAMSRCVSPLGLRVENFDRRFIMAAESCVRFYNDLEDSSSASADLPEYIESPDADQPPEYAGDYATDVAASTQPRWDNTEVRYPLLREPSLEAQIMMGDLSLQESASSSQLDFEA